MGGTTVKQNGSLPTVVKQNNSALLQVVSISKHLKFIDILQKLHWRHKGDIVTNVLFIALSLKERFSYCLLFKTIAYWYSLTRLLV